MATTPADSGPVVERDNVYEVTREDARVSEVEVFADRVEVTRTVPFAPKSAGTFRVRISQLPNFGPSTVRVSGSGSFTILDVSNSEEEAEGPAESRLQELEVEYRRLLKEERAAEQRLTRLRASRSRVLKFAHQTIRSSASGSRKGVESARATMEMATARVEEVDEKINAEEDRLSDLSTHRLIMATLLRKPMSSSSSSAALPADEVEKMRGMLLSDQRDVLAEVVKRAQVVSQAQNAIVGAKRAAVKKAAPAAPPAALDALGHLLDAVASPQAQPAAALCVQQNALSAVRDVRRRQRKARKVVLREEQVQRLQRGSRGRGGRGPKAHGTAAMQDEEEEEEEERRTQRCVVVVVKVDEPGEFSLSLKYITKEASWAPAYDLRLDSATNKLMVNYYGKVKQTTGEDWAGVQLSLSTATPHVVGKPPSVQALVAQIRVAHVFTKARMQKKSHRARGARMQRRSMAMEEEDESDSYASEDSDERAGPAMASAGGGGGGGGSAGGESDDDGDAVHATAAVRTGLSSTFAVGHACDIASDDKTHRFTVTSLEMDTRVVHYAVPYETARAYLKAVTTNTSDYPLLPSSDVGVFVDNSFVTTSRMPYVSPGETFSSFLGVDPAVRMEVLPMRRHAAHGGWVRARRQDRYRALTTITNSKSVPLSLVLRDSLPSAPSTSLRVAMSKPTPLEVENGARARKALGGSSADDATVASKAHVVVSKSGCVEWVVHVPAGGTASVPFEWRVEYPAEIRVAVVRAG